MARKRPGAGGDGRYHVSWIELTHLWHYWSLRAIWHSGRLFEQPEWRVHKCKLLMDLKATLSPITASWVVQDIPHRNVIQRCLGHALLSFYSHINLLNSYIFPKQPNIPSDGLRDNLGRKSTHQTPLSISKAYFVGSSRPGSFRKPVLAVKRHIFRARGQFIFRSDLERSPSGSQPPGLAEGEKLCTKQMFSEVCPEKKWPFFQTQTSGTQIVTGKRHAQNNQGRGHVAAVPLAKGLTADTVLS